MLCAPPFFLQPFQSLGLVPSDHLPESRLCVRGAISNSSWGTPRLRRVLTCITTSKEDCEMIPECVTLFFNVKLWQPTPVFLPGECHGRRSPVGYSPLGRKESDTTERLHFTLVVPGLSCGTWDLRCVMRDISAVAGGLSSCGSPLAYALVTPRHVGSLFPS